MRLAVGDNRAFGPALQRQGRAFYDRPQTALPMLRWWKEKSVEGVVFYDSLPGFYEITPAQWRGIKAVVDEAGLEVAAFNALRKSLHMPERADYERQRLDTCLAACEILRPAIFDMSVNAPYPLQWDADTLAHRQATLFRGAYAPDAVWNTVAAALKTLAQQCAGIGAQLSIELHDDGMQDTAANCLRLVKLIDETNVGVNPDIGNAYRVPYEIHETGRQMMQMMAPLTNYWEVKNYHRLYFADERRWYAWDTELDDGDLNFREGAEILWRAGFRGWVCYEHGSGDGIWSAVKYLRYMRWILDEWIPFVMEAYPE